LNDAREGNVETLVNLFNHLSYKDWRAFSNHSTRIGGSRGSIEGFHDDYHGLIGGSFGHMAIATVAAFDPVFWLQHW
jgi:hypothetical protein